MCSPSACSLLSAGNRPEPAAVYPILCNFLIFRIADREFSGHPDLIRFHLQKPLNPCTINASLVPSVRQSEDAFARRVMEDFMHGTLGQEDVSERCVRMIRDCCGGAIHDLQTTRRDDLVRITGLVGSWHGKQLASEAARSLFPGLRIENQLKVIKPR